jgi:hypothetical protein
MRLCCRSTPAQKQLTWSKSTKKVDGNPNKTEKIMFAALEGNHPLTIQDLRKLLGDGTYDLQALLELSERFESIIGDLNEGKSVGMLPSGIKIIPENLLRERPQRLLNTLNELIGVFAVEKMINSHLNVPSGTFSADNLRKEFGDDYLDVKGIELYERLKTIIENLNEGSTYTIQNQIFTGPDEHRGVRKMLRPPMIGKLNSLISTLEGVNQDLAKS